MGFGEERGGGGGAGTETPEPLRHSGSAHAPVPDPTRRGRAPRAPQTAHGVCRTDAHARPRRRHARAQKTAKPCPVRPGERPTVYIRGFPGEGHTAPARPAPPAPLTGAARPAAAGSAPPRWAPPSSRRARGGARHDEGGGPGPGPAPPSPLVRLSRGRGGASGRAGNMAEAEGESLESWLSEYPAVPVPTPGPQHRSPQHRGPLSLPGRGPSAPLPSAWCTPTHTHSPPPPPPQAPSAPGPSHRLTAALLPPFPAAPLSEAGDPELAGAVRGGW